MSSGHLSLAGAGAPVPGGRRRSWWLTGLRFVCVLPPLLMSTLLVEVVASALPEWAGSCLMCGWVAAGLFLFFGIGESLAVRILFRARTLKRSEASGLSAAVTDLCHLALGPPLVDIYVCRRPGGRFAVARGRRSIVLSPELVAAVVACQITTGEAVAVIAHASLTARSGIVRHDPAFAFWSLPWQAVRTLGRPLHGAVGFAWRLRLVVFGAAIWQCLMERPVERGLLAGPAVGATLAILLLLTYLWPRCVDRWNTAVTTTTDRELIARGLGHPTAAFLRRLPQSPGLIGHVQALDPPVHQQPHLRIVGSEPDRTGHQV